MMEDDTQLVLKNTVDASPGNTPTNHAPIPLPNNFEFLEPELWPLWKNRFQSFIDGADLAAKTEAEKIDILCYAMGEQSKVILAQVIPDIEGKNLADVLQAFTDHFCSEENIKLQRYRFNTRTQQPDESIDQFITALQTLAESCQYGMIKNELIRDRIIAGISDSEISKKLQLEPDLTLENVMTIARQTEVELVQQEISQDVSLSSEINCSTAQRENEKGEIELGHANEKDFEVVALCNIMEHVLKNLTLRNFDRMISRIRTLGIDSTEKLEGIVDLIFEKAVDDPNFTTICASMCKELAMVQVSGPNSKAGKKESNVNFRKLIITQCQTEFEKNTVNETATAIKLKEIGACADPEKKKELQVALTEEKRRIRIKSVGNIRFIGELFKQGMLTTDVMHRCIRHLMTKIDEESLECLCKLLSTIGKDLESKGQNLEPYFKQMHDIVDREGPDKVSSRVRFMLQDVIELRINKWIPRRDDSNPKTVDQIQKEAETKRLNTYLYNNPLNTLRTYDRHWVRRSNRGGGGVIKEGGWSVAPVRGSRQQYSTEPSKLKNKPPPMDNLQVGNKNMFRWSRGVSVVSTMSEEQLAKKSANILEEYLSDTNISNAALEIRETFDNSTFANFVREALNLVVEKSSTARKQVSLLLTHLIAKNILPLSLYLAGLGKVLDMAEDLVIDIPKIWVYLAELIWYPLAEGVHPFSELKTMMAPLKSKGLAGKLMGELMITLVQEKSPKWIKDKWDQAGLEWGAFLQENESLDDFIKKYKLEFLFGDSNNGTGSLSGQLSMEQIQERLCSLMSNEKENSFDNIYSWISANVGERASEPQFIRVLMTAILEVSIEPYNNTWKFRSDKFNNLQTLISRYIDLNELLELQCLIAIQEYIHKLEHPSGVLLQIIEKLSDDSILSYDAFRAWESNKDPTALTGKSVAMMALTSFFTSLKETDDESSAEEV